MPTAENAKVEYEAGQDLVSFVELTDDGDHIEYNSADTLWSNRSNSDTDYSPDVKPNGLVTGGKVIPGVSGTEEKVDVAGLTCYLIGVLTTVTAAVDEAVVRPASGKYNKTSIQVVAAGTISMVLGSDGDAFSTVRDAAGGPPLILVGSIEIAQVWLYSDATAVIAASEIKAVPGDHTEWYNYPAWTVDRIRVENNTIGVAGINFLSALPLSHTAAVPKKVYAEYYTPSMAEVPNAYDFVRPANSHSVTSAQVYNGTIGTSSSSLGQGSFGAHLEDGVSDNILTLESEILWFRFYPDRLKTPYVMCQGKLGVAESYPADNSLISAFTISADTQGRRVVS